MKKMKSISLGCILLSMLTSVNINAGVTNSFNDRDLWETQVILSGSTLLIEDFNVVSDTQLTEGISNDVGLFNVTYTTQSGVDESGNQVVNASGSSSGLGLIFDDYLRVEWDLLGADLTQSLEFQFDSPISAFGANFRFNDTPSDWTLTLDGESVEIFSILSASTEGFIGFVLDNPVSSITFSEIMSEDFLFIDRVSFNASAVPVPPAVWLFGSALIGLVGFRKRASLQATS